jgi:hypothetical protein
MGRASRCFVYSGYLSVFQARSVFIRHMHTPGPRTFSMPAASKHRRHSRPASLRTRSASTLAAVATPEQHRHMQARAAFPPVLGTPHVPPHPREAHALAHRVWGNATAGLVCPCTGASIRNTPTIQHQVLLIMVLASHLPLLVSGNLERHGVVGACIDQPSVSGVRIGHKRPKRVVHLPRCPIAVGELQHTHVSHYEYRRRTLCELTVWLNVSITGGAVRRVRYVQPSRRLAVSTM